jgi:Leucine-rich repeat (LRR) protein
LEELRDTLKELYLQENKIVKIENVNILSKLVILDISYNLVEHIEGIDNLKELDALYLTTNKIDNVGELKVLEANAKLTTVLWYLCRFRYLGMML